MMLVVACVALGASPLAGAEFSYARGVISCSGVDLGLQTEYVVCKAGEWFKAWVCLSSFANAFSEFVFDWSEFEL
jgi:hypothetical protein